MRKSLLFLSLTVLAGMTAAARSLSPSEALGRALNGHGVASRSMSVSSEPVMTIGQDESPSIYVFNGSDEGYVIVSADDVAAPVIGYSDKGTFDPENIPENFQAWLDMCSEQIRSASSLGAAPYVQTATVSRTPIEPLLSVTWNQTAPYNMLCPMMDGQRTVTGCVATAMAEVMKYHNWPDKAAENAKLSYDWWHGVTETLSADFSNFEFDWGNMLNDYEFTSYTGAQAEAVAKLMQACGYSVRMSYGLSASGSFGAYIGDALVNYFKYDAGLHNEPRDLYSAVEWENMIYESLKNCGPVVYWGTGSVGHCFVCDGYRGSGYFHFNWGWGGMSDGYFLLNMLNPGSVGVGGGTGGGFNIGQGALLGVKPASGSAPSERKYTLYASQGITETFLDRGLLSMFGQFMNYSPYTLKGRYVYRVYSESGDGATYLMSIPLQTPAPEVDYLTLDYTTMIEGKIPETLADGTYSIYPAFEADGVEHVFAVPGSYNDCVTLTREGGVDRVSLHASGSLSVENLSTNGDIYHGKRFRVTGTAKYSVAGGAERAVSVRLLNADGGIIGYSSDATLQFSTEGESFDVVCNWFSSESPIAMGNYTLAFFNGAENIGSCPVTISDGAGSGTYEVVKIEVENSDAVDANDVKVIITVNGLTGLVDETMTLSVTRGITPVMTVRDVPVFVTEGKTAEIKYTLTLPTSAAIIGQTYYLSCSKSGSMVSKPSKSTPFTVGDPSGIEDIDTDDADAPAEYFNLNGVRVDADNMAPGVYICRKGSKVSKILVR